MQQGKARFALSSTCSFYLTCNGHFAMPANQIRFENLHFNSVYKESFSDTDDERDLDENSFDEVNTKNFECSYLLLTEI